MSEEDLINCYRNVEDFIFDETPPGEGRDALLASLDAVRDGNFSS